MDVQKFRLEKGMIFWQTTIFEVAPISRGKGHSVTKRANYISGERLRDNYKHETYYRKRDDVMFNRIYRPANAPPEFYDLQNLCDSIEKAEKRCDARTAREFKCSLPNELPLREQINIVSEFVINNFVEHGLCAIVAIHEGRNVDDPTRNNPHVHIIVPTRTVDSDGFSKKKDREHDKRDYIVKWRKHWALAQNRAYERNGLDIRVSHESLEVQGIRDREPTIHISRIDWQREKRGERTRSGDRKREIRKRNMDRKRQLEKEREINREVERDRSR
ncbi:MAG: MobA/MobL family protein [Lachnospiraceae bacterium]|nr:MobA/MobL family protein [Lachnospiraceae bacterium]